MYRTGKVKAPLNAAAIQRSHRESRADRRAGRTADPRRSTTERSGPNQTDDQAKADGLGVCTNLATTNS
jgi:hypothetical protein